MNSGGPGGNGTTDRSTLHGGFPQLQVEDLATSEGRAENVEPVPKTILVSSFARPQVNLTSRAGAISRRFP
ncbi:MAG: hypothetical protein KGJ23_12135 [Euryarchaeota archaeon]|nr:hypothetical protein [Euryarchaeota archaeon]MDE1837346.1 hypothetical protein [Euryarchaeota archaeon]MDE1880922.1 hypothetical protein [Euryarchaeota archaeon]MDE2045624.1 hypothetical protein [Thermoplasmata archaeon]